jgi:hypothetical protein
MNEIYQKDTPGAEILYKPEFIKEYDGESWDLRVSIDNNPLDESFYITIEDPAILSWTLQKVISEYILNSVHKTELDIAEDPDLPFYMDELQHIFEAEKARQLKLEFYINHGSKVQLYDKAEKHLSSCTYDDKSWDYRLVDLVVKPLVAEPASWEKSDFEGMYDRLFLIHLMNYHNCSSLEGRLSEDVSRELYRRFNYGAVSEHFTLTKEGFEIVNVALTDKGQKYSAELEKTLTDYDQKYSPFGAVSIEPLALGVEKGFDVSLQMMEIDDINIKEAIIHKVIDSRKNELLGDWHQHYLDRTGLEEAYSSLAYKSHFSREVLLKLRGLPH